MRLARTIMRASCRLLLVLPAARAYWDGAMGTDDPYTQAMKMSRQAAYDHGMPIEPVRQERHRTVRPDVLKLGHGLALRESRWLP